MSCSTRATRDSPSGWCSRCLPQEGTDMPPDTHDQPARGHQGVLVASAEHPDPRVKPGVAAAAAPPNNIWPRAPPPADMTPSRSGAAVAAIPLDDLCPPADPTRLVRRTLEEG